MGFLFFLGAISRTYSSLFPNFFWVSNPKKIQKKSIFHSFGASAIANQIVIMQPTNSDFIVKL